MSDLKIVYRCAGCGALLEENEVEPYGESLCHVVPALVREGEVEPQPCGPVLEYDTSIGTKDAGLQTASGSNF